MYKLVAVGGKIRGKEFELKEGENIFGRSPECENQVDIQGISKRHISITVNGDSCFVEDLGSSNGTFVNGKLISKKTVVGGDKIALPNVIFQLVFVKESKVIVKKKVAKTHDSGDENDKDGAQEIMPTHLPGKVVFLFKTKIMPILYGFNQSYEWNVLIGILLFIFIVINIGLTIAPVLSTSKDILVNEIRLRGESYADEVVRFNAVALNNKDLDKINTNFLDNQKGVKSYELFDLEGRIVRPIGKINTYINDSFSVETRKWVTSKEENIHKVYAKFLGDGEIGISRAVKAYDIRTGREDAVGIIAIRFAPESLVEATSNASKSYLESLTTSALVAVIFFGMIYYLTLRPIEEMRTQIEDVLRGRRKELESNLLMKEIHTLRSTVNSVLQRWRESQGGQDGVVIDVEDPAPYIRRLKEFQMGSQGPVLVLDGDKNIISLNTQGEDLLGFRESSASGTSLLDTARDQGFAATVIELCDASSNNDGCCQQGEYELGGVGHKISVVSLMGKDNFSKGFYITFNKD